MWKFYLWIKFTFLGLKKIVPLLEFVLLVVLHRFSMYTRQEEKSPKIPIAEMWDLTHQAMRRMESTIEHTTSHSSRLSAVFPLFLLAPTLHHSILITVTQDTIFLLFLPLTS